MNSAGIPGTESAADIVDDSQVRALGRGTVAGIINFVLFCVGSIINAAAYASLQPLSLAAAFFLSGLIFLTVLGIGGQAERKIFVRVFVVGWVAAGIAAIYAESLDDPTQLASDAGSFFELASGRASGLSLENLRTIHEGGLAIILWRALYDFTAALGFERERFIGILVNVVSLAASGAIAARTALEVYGEDPYRLRRLTLLFSGCGLFWLFAGIHLRDAVVLLAITAIVHTWVLFLSAPGRLPRLLVMLATSVVGAAFLGFLRGEFTFVPIALGFAGTAALMLSTREGAAQKLKAYSLILVGIVASGLLVARFRTELHFVLGLSSGYAELAAEHHGRDSLGMALIVEQPWPVRMLLGSIYLYVFPIPFWAGVGGNSAYDLFKSVNALFFYFVIPLVALSVSHLTHPGAGRSATMLFLAFVAAGFTLGIAVTSLETRHLGAFFTPLFLLALAPDLRDRSTWSKYKGLLMAMLLAMSLIHGLWGILKLV